jgi:hypothetical protein
MGQNRILIYRNANKLQHNSTRMKKNNPIHYPSATTPWGFLVDIDLWIGEGKSFTRLWSRCQQRRCLRVSWTFLEELLGCFLLGFDFPGENLSSGIGGATTSTTSFPSWSRRFGNHDLARVWRFGLAHVWKVGVGWWRRSKLSLSFFLIFLGVRCRV